MLRQAKHIIAYLCCILCLVANAVAQNPVVIPAPVQYTTTPGYFYFRPTSYILVHDMASFQDAVTYRDLCIKAGLPPLKTLREQLYDEQFIEVQYDSTLNVPDGGYTLSITPTKISVTGKNDGGVLHGLMSLLQLTESKFTGQFQVPCADITDYPRFSYRGMHLDCSRHFFSVDFVKQYIDYLALYKMNTFHWHLTDDQGWRIEIKKYPKLTEIGAWRDGSMVGHYRDQKFDTIRYGGYYTQAEIKEIVKYAERRHVTVIPEIEMPGHCTAALAAYPQLGCIADTTYAVEKSWGVLQNAFCPKDETFTFLYDVLDEVMALFPSQYIHIGGDEVEKTQWKNCAHCQALIKEKGLQDEHGLQSYFIRQIDTYVTSKGRTIIGWDEILEGGLAPNAAVMSWRGEDGAIAAAQQGHDAVMTPGGYCYFDYYQGYPYNEPLAIGGYVPLSKVYSFEPVPSKLTAEQSKHILGAQANVWTEYIYSEDHVEYMMMPRMLALSEVVWSPKEQRNYNNFISRLQNQFDLLDKLNCNYSRSAFAFSYTISNTPNYDGLTVALNSWNDTTGFSYAHAYFPVPLLGYKEKPTESIYNGPFTIVENTHLNIPATKNIPAFDLRLRFTKATGKKITLGTQPDKRYPGNGGLTVTDGIRGTTYPSWSGAEWLGYSGTDFDCVIDLNKKDTINAVSVGCLSDRSSWIWPAKAMEVSVSMDGKNFQRVGVVGVEDLTGPSIDLLYKFTPVAARYVKIHVTNNGIIPAGNPGAGYKAWLFVDEVFIE